MKFIRVKYTNGAIGYLNSFYVVEIIVTEAGATARYIVGQRLDVAQIIDLGEIETAAPL